MKKLFVIVSLAALVAFTSKALVLVNGNVLGINVPTLLTTNRASVYSITVSGTQSGSFYLFDSDNTNNIPTSAAVGTWGTNYVSGTNITSKTYATNYVTSYVGYLGYTNWYTNAGQWTYLITNLPATNALTPMAAGAVGANQVATYPLDAIFNRGVVITATTNLAVILNYNTGQ
jgi:hypothetical protein